MRKPALKKSSPTGSTSASSGRNVATATATSAASPAQSAGNRVGSARAVALNLVKASHPRESLILAVGVALAALASGRAAREVGLVFVTVLLGRVTIGWLNDVADRDRDRVAARGDKPVALNLIHPSTVTFATACATCLLVPLSISNGTYAGIAHLLAVAAAWAGNTRVKLTAFSPVPWALYFGLLPVFLAYGGWGGVNPGSAPNAIMVVLAAALGVAVHFVLALPDLVGDNRAGVKSAPVLAALKLTAARLLIVSTAATGALILALTVVGLTTGLRS